MKQAVSLPTVALISTAMAEHLNVPTLIPLTWLRMDRLVSLVDAKVSETISQCVSISVLSTGPRHAPVPLRTTSASCAVNGREVRAKYQKTISTYQLVPTAALASA
jgi:hypothetical protein